MKEACVHLPWRDGLRQYSLAAHRTLLGPSGMYSPLLRRPQERTCHQDLMVSAFCQSCGVRHSPTMSTSFLLGKAMKTDQQDALDIPSAWGNGRASCRTAIMDLARAWTTQCRFST